MINITENVRDKIKRLGIRDGMITVLTLHTTTGITVNESLECLEEDIQELLADLVPEDKAYHHARMLRDYGSTAGNATGHLKSLLCGNHCHFVVKDGQVILGGAQQVYFCEFDGPAKRTYLIIVEE